MRSDLPLSFCRTRWVENSRVATRAINILPNLQSYLDQRIASKSELKSKSYSSMKENLSDKFLPLRLTAFNSIACILEKFLVKFQSDDPMVPYLYSDLYDMIYSLMKKVVKDDLIVGSTAKSIVKIDINNEKNLKGLDQVDLGFAVTEQISRSRQVLCRDDIKNFRMLYRAFIIVVINKLLSRCPLKFELVKGATCLDPKIFLDRSRNEGRLDLALKQLVSHKVIDGEEADQAKQVYMSLANNPSARDKAFTKEERLDDFWFKNMLKIESNEALLKMVQNILVLSHGQATVESGFSINDSTIVENQLEETLISYRRVYDHVLRLKVPVDQFVVSRGLINAVKASRSRYHSSLLKRKDDETQKAREIEYERKRIREEIIEKQEQHKRLKKESESLEKEINILKQIKV